MIEAAGNSFDEVYRVVRRIPRGKVATYGQVSRLLEGRFSPVFVGWALHALPSDRSDVPWHRVVNARGELSVSRVSPDAGLVQRALLEAEGVCFDEDGVCDLKAHGWNPIRLDPGDRRPRRRTRDPGRPACRADRAPGR